MNLHSCFILFYLILHYLCLYLWHSTSYLLLHAVTYLLVHATTCLLAHVVTHLLAHATTLLLTHAMTPHAFASVICGITNTFPCIVGGVELWATYDLIGKSWAGTRYMYSEPCNTLSFSSVLDHHWGVTYLDYFLKLSKLPLQVHPSQTSQTSLTTTPSSKAVHFYLLGVHCSVHT